MKAKEILNLYEGEKLTNEEIFDLISNYFKKRFKSIGAEILFNLKESHFPYAEIRLPSSKMTERSLRSYHLQIIQNIDGKQTGKDSRGILWIIFPASSSSEYLRYLFSVGVFWNKYLKQMDIMIKFTGYFYTLYQDSKLPDVINRDELQAIYALIDRLVKNIRLTSTEVF